MLLQYRVASIFTIKSLFILVICLFFTGCSSSQTENTTEQPPEVLSQVTQAVVSPLNDLNLFQQDIPLILLTATNNPYHIPEDLSCDMLAAEITALNAVLGSDLDMPQDKTEADLLDKGNEAANKAVIKALRRTTESVIPFRSWVRKFSGAERHSQEQLTAIAAGTIRRAFLKGIGHTQGCSSPAAPYIANLSDK
ncbi:hypothetical protein QE250_09665 [Chromatiaceae bacterium AAb-1]|nr:hypothetical protein [Chromatiaceae bacterium AAb-1]